jgi:hypothetical protein
MAATHPRTQAAVEEGINFDDQHDNSRAHAFCFTDSVIVAAATDPPFKVPFGTWNRLSRLPSLLPKGKV